MATDKWIRTKAIDEYWNAMYGSVNNKYLDRYGLDMESFWDYGEWVYNNFNIDVEEHSGRLERNDNGYCTCCYDEDRCNMYGNDKYIQSNCDQEHIMDIIICYMVGGEEAVKEYREKDIWATNKFYEEIKRIINIRRPQYNSYPLHEMMNRAMFERWDKVRPKMGSYQIHIGIVHSIDKELFGLDSDDLFIIKGFDYNQNYFSWIATDKVGNSEAMHEDYDFRKVIELNADIEWINIELLENLEELYDLNK